MDLIDLSLHKSRLKIGLLSFLVSDWEVYSWAVLLAFPPYFQCFQYLLTTMQLQSFQMSVFTEKNPFCDFFHKI